MNTSTPISNQPVVSSEKSRDIEQILKRYDPYIVSSVKKHFYSSSKSIIELEELVQQVRFELWQILEKHPKLHLKAIIHPLLRSLYIDFLRKQRSSSQSLQDQNPWDELENTEEKAFFLRCTLNLQNPTQTDLLLLSRTNAAQSTRHLSPAPYVAPYSVPATSHSLPLH